ncbi:MAG: O-antigen ligase C-terminal domain-containing protein [Nitrosomonadales bacterium]|nr:O-antigen ligase C-terminal domain-containing protein [Nitrosomonadales bacterium]
MLSTSFSPSLLARISLFFTGLMWALPFLLYYHAYPLTTFYQEWSAVVLGMCAMLLLATGRQRYEIPRIVMLPIGLLLLALLQFALGGLPYFGQVLLIAEYLLWAVLLIMLGRQLRAEFGLPALSAALALFLLAGTELNAMIGIMQHYSWHTIFDAVITAKIASAVYGNLGQPNHYADYIMLGLVSLGLLRTHWRMPAWQVALPAAPLLFVLVLSGSRSAWLYLLCIVAMAWLWQRRDAAFRPLLHYCLMLILGFGLMHLIVYLPGLSAASSSVTTVDRMMAPGSASFGWSGSIRLHIWYEAGLTFIQHPLLGAGYGQFAWQHFLLGPVLRDTGIVGLYNNAHNLLMQMAAETGLAGLLILFGTLGLWVRQAYQAQRSVYHWWGYGLLAVLGIHSLVEYPLWYTYFLGITALTLGMLDHSAYRLELRNAGRFAVAVLLLLGTLSMAQLLRDYRKLENLASMSSLSADYSRRMRDGLAKLDGQLLLQPYTELFKSSMIKIDAAHLAEQRALNERAMHFVPIGSVVYREALLLALSGEQDAARAQMERAIWSYPDDFPKTRNELGELTQKDPAHFAALLEFALQKNEERQRAAISVR